MSNVTIAADGTATCSIHGMLYPTRALAAGDTVECGACTTEPAPAREAPAPVCPVHHIPDCSPLLNGCSWSTRVDEARPDGEEPEHYVSPFLLDGRTPEERAEAIRAAEAREAADRVEALGILTDHFRNVGVPTDAIEAVMPAIDALLNPRLDRSHGILTGGMLVPVYAYHNPVPNDPQWPEYEAYAERQRQALAAARHYRAVRLTTGWIEDANREDNA